MSEISIYEDIALRTDGDIYLGVVGPVRTGKSTFIKRFMETLVIPRIDNLYMKERARDELPQSGSGRTIMTAEPKFIPEDAVSIRLSDEAELSVRLIDCVGYMVSGASGQFENGAERMVTTPWFDQEITLTDAAEKGTYKVIAEHSTIGLVVTCDGSFSDLPRESYLAAEERTITELKALNKPFLVIVNSSKPYSEEAIAVADEITVKYGVKAIPVNCAQLKKEDIHRLLTEVMYEFPIARLEFYMPKWVELLESDHKVKADMCARIAEYAANLNTMRDVVNSDWHLASEYINHCKMDSIDMATGKVSLSLSVDDGFYYEMLSDILGKEIINEWQLIETLKQVGAKMQEYSKVENAVDSVRIKGYGVVTPEKSDIRLEKPEIIKHGNKYGVKIIAHSPSIHMIKADIESEISPIVGTQEQANDLINFINAEGEKSEGIWETNIFGKTVEQLVQDGINQKVMSIGEESQVKLQDTMQKIVNESNGGMVCIII
ncbi:MAG: stage IV sporulation protein A [Lachnospiraceae bacterium]|nr:stage IV sporulation protein A [Lachnospiraceae bacterium]